MSVLFSLQHARSPEDSDEEEEVSISPFYFNFDCLRDNLVPRVQIFPTATSVPVSSMHGSNSPQTKPRTAMGAWRPERVCQEGKDEPLGLLPPGAAPWRGQAGNVLLVGRLGTAGLCGSTSTREHPRLSSWFPIACPALSHALVCSCGCRRQIQAGPVLSPLGSERADAVQGL